MSKDAVQDKVERIAQICHQANREFQILFPVEGIPVSKLWDELSDVDKQLAYDGVIGAMNGDTPMMSHITWMDNKAADGWTYGPVKDEDRKEHPCMVPYSELSQRDRDKDALFVSIVKT